MIDPYQLVSKWWLFHMWLVFSSKIKNKCGLYLLYYTWSCCLYAFQLWYECFACKSLNHL